MYLLDSVILIDHFNNIPQATQFLSQFKSSSSLSMITRAEVLTGFSGRAVKTAKSFLDCFELLSLSKDDADLAAELRNKYRWKLPDAIQAAVAMNHKFQLVTRNSKDFPTKKFDFVLQPYQLIAN